VSRDGNRFDYRVETVETFTIETAPIAEMFSQETDDERLTLFTAVPPYDPVSERYTGVFVVQATRRAGSPSSAPDQSPAAVDAPDGCPVTASRLDLPAATAPYPGTEALNLPAARATSDDVIAEIAMLLEDASDCDLGVRSALTSADGSVLALVGPLGDLPLDAVRSILDEDLRPLDDTLAALCAFMLFVQEGGEWRVIQVPNLDE